MLEFNLLLVFMIIAAIIAIQVKDLLSAIVAIGASGLALCIAFLFLKAPDLAITQIVVEILCLIILIRATIRKDLPFSASGRWLFNTLAAIVFIAVFLYFGWFALKELPSFGSPTMQTSQFYLREEVLEKEVKAANIVSAIILNFRAYDTLGEATVLFTAVIAVMAVMRRKGRKKINERDEDEF